MKMNQTIAVMSAVLALSAAVLFTPLAARADTGWSSFVPPDIDYPYSAHAADKGFESGFAVNGGRILTQQEMDEARAHIGIQTQPTYSAAYTANVHIPLDKEY